MSKVAQTAGLFDGEAEPTAPDATEGASEALGAVSGVSGVMGSAVDASPAMADPFDLTALRLGQDFGAAIGVKKAITTVPVRKPDKQSFVRVRPGEAWRLQTFLLEFKEERESYLVAPALWPELGAELKPVCLFTGITRQGVLFLWPIKLPGADGRADSWSESALEAAKLCERAWCRVVANMALGGYDVLEAQAVANLPEPEWPALTLQEIVKIAFRGRLVDSLDHPAVRRLQGAA